MTLIGEKRGELEILRDVLELAISGERKTRIMYRANLSYEMLNRYVGVLVQRGFLVPSDGGAFTVTDDGRALLQDVERVVRRFREPDPRPPVLEETPRPPHAP